jgi:hypothetical protein
LAPRNFELIDFPSRAGELLNTLAVVEDRSPIEIFNDLIVANADVIRVRTHARTGEDEGSLSLEDGLSVYEKAREMVLAAACSTNPRHPLRQIQHVIDDRITEIAMQVFQLRLRFSIDRNTKRRYSVQLRVAQCFARILSRIPRIA